jgi:ketosteroid isomerase-like protein
MAKREGYKASFLKYLAPDAIMFFNGPVPARKRVSERPDLPGLLQWYPDYALVSSSGDVGLSTGPWVYTSAGKPPAYGHFFSIWRKQADGSWLNALDVGIDHEQMQPAPTKLKVSASTGPTQPTSAKGKDTTAAVRAAEEQFAQLAATQSYAAAVSRMGHPDLRVYRDGRAPVLGFHTAVPYVEDLGPVGAPKPDVASGSGDFGYAYGMIARRQGTGSSHAFVHVWKEEAGKWQLLADLLTPVVEAKTQ